MIERDGYRSRLADHESAVGCGFRDNVARAVSCELGAEGFRVARDRLAEIVDEALTVETDEVSLLSRQFVLLDARRIPSPLVIDNPLDPVRDRNARIHINALRSQRDSTLRVTRDRGANGEIQL